MVLLAGCGDSKKTGAQACKVAAPGQKTLMKAYAQAPGYAVASDLPDRVSVDVPRVALSDGRRTSATLPVGPCQTIYRFHYASLDDPDGAARSPFRYVEVDWNTEGVPRGPNKSIVSAHFDFHFYMRPRHEVEARTKCASSNHRVCDALLTGYGQMRRFLRMPPPSDVPVGYRPDIDSSIPAMGLHVLDSRVRYTVDWVDHNPMLFYGTFDGQMLFAEASVALPTLRDAQKNPAHVLSFPFRQPRVRPAGLWPTRFVIRYLPASGGFRAGFERFR